MFSYTSPAFPRDRLFSRQQLQLLTGISDDVLGFWLRAGLLVPEPAEGRAHRRFAFDQVNIAVVLEAMRGLGANIGVLRAFSRKIQVGASVARRGEGLDYTGVRMALELSGDLERFRRGETVMVRTEEWWKAVTAWRAERGEWHPIPMNRPAVDQQQIVDNWQRVNEIEGASEKARQFASGLSEDDAPALDDYLDLIMPEIMRDRDPDFNWVWLGWIDREGNAQIASGEDGNVAINAQLPTAAFYISVSRLIRRVWMKSGAQ